MRALLERLLGFLVRVRRTLHGETFDAGGKRDGAGHAGASALDGFDDVVGGLVYDAVVISLQSNSDALRCHTKNNCLLMVFLQIPLPEARGGTNIRKTGILCNDFFEYFRVAPGAQNPGQWAKAPVPDKSG